MPENSLPPFHPSQFSVCSNLQMVAMLARWVMVMGRDRVDGNAQRGSKLEMCKLLRLI